MPNRRQVLLGLAALTVPLNAWAHGTSPKGWTKLSQSKKNLRIVSAALAQVGSLSKLSCKVWVQRIVKAASDDHVDVPLNDNSNLHRWKVDQDGHITVVGSSIEKAKAGNIVQMITKSGWEHTAIIAEVNSTNKTVMFVDSNFDNTPADESDAKVQSRTVSFTDFYASLKKPSLLTIYQVS